MGVLVQVQHFDVVELDVEVLVDRLQNTTDPDIILKLDCDGLVGESLEKTAAKDMSVQSRLMELRNGLGLHLKKSMAAEAGADSARIRKTEKK